MKTVWDEGERNELLARFASLSHDRKPRWGIHEGAENLETNRTQFGV